jgi:AraC-like DNA-binding protein
VERRLDRCLPQSAAMTMDTLVSSRMQYVKRYIESQLTQPITLEHLASVVYLSPFVVIRQFKAAVGTTPYAYLTACRAALARCLLTRSSMAIADVGRRVGYDDPNYFARFFKRMTGASPSDYRETARRGQRPGPIRCNCATNTECHVAQPSLEYCISK